MAKKQNRRIGLSSNRQQNRTEPAANDDRKTDKVHSRTILLLFFIVSSIISVIVYRTINSPVTNPSLVRTDADYDEILTENAKVSENSSTRHFNHPLLAYITPWNSRGYEMAKIFTSKFTHISPVCQGTNLILEGRHNADLGWISDLRMRGEAKILPSVVLEAIPMEFLKKKKIS